MDTAIEKDCSVLELLFHQIIADMKNNVAIWEDFSSKGNRLHTALKTAMVCLNAFLESFQRVADMASGTKGATKDVGSALTRLCLRQRSIEGKMKLFTNSIVESLVVPMMEKMEDWKKSLVVMDREHARENKRGHQEIKKTFSEAQKEHKKLKKSGASKQEEVERLYKSTNEKLLQLRENEMNAVRGALIEERHRLCLFVACLKPVMDEEISLLSEVTHLQEIVDNLCMLADDPDSLPATGEQVICDTIGRGLTTSTSQISSDQTTTSLKVQHTTSTDDQQQEQQEQQQQQKSQTVQQQTSSRQHSMESPSSELSAESSVSDSFSSSATSPSKTARAMAQIADRAARDSSEKQHGGARIVSIESKSTDQDRPKGHPLTCTLPVTSIPPSSASPHNYSQLLTHHRNPSLTSTGAKEIRYLDPTSLIGSRPHTISYVRERSYTRPLLTAETYEAFGGMSGQANGSPYAVPCIIPKRRSTQVGSEKVADIYARPSLAQSHGGYRTPNIKPLPVATPTVPDSGNIPGMPLTGYVNMNQLATIALHQTNPIGKREAVNRESMPDIESLRFAQCQKHQVDQLQQSTSMLIGREARIIGRDHRRQISLDAGQMAKLSEPSSGSGESVKLIYEDLL